MAKLAGAGLLLIIAAPASRGWWPVGCCDRCVTSPRSLDEGSGDRAHSPRSPGSPRSTRWPSRSTTSAARIGQLLQRERQLTADTSHQLRTPLAGLRLSLEGELARPSADPSQIIEEALGAVHRLEQTVAELAALARGETPAVPFSAREVLDHAHDRWLEAFARKGRGVEVTGPSVVLSGVRRSAVDVVLDVLLDNALEHGSGVVGLRVRNDDQGVVVTVSDEGSCRLTDADLFARRSSTGSGHGIGLPLARALATDEGAHLRLDAIGPDGVHPRDCPAGMGNGV